MITTGMVDVAVEITVTVSVTSVVVAAVVHTGLSSFYAPSAASSLCVVLKFVRVVFHFMESGIPSSSAMIAGVDLSLEVELDPTSDTNCCILAPAAGTQPTSNFHGPSRPADASTCERWVSHGHRPHG